PGFQRGGGPAALARPGGLGGTRWAGQLATAGGQDERRGPGGQGAQPETAYPACPRPGPAHGVPRSAPLRPRFQVPGSGWWHLVWTVTSQGAERRPGPLSALDYTPLTYGRRQRFRSASTSDAGCRPAGRNGPGQIRTAAVVAAQTPAACMPRSSCLSSLISSLIRAATSNWSSAAATCIWSVSWDISAIRSPRAAPPPASTSAALGVARTRCGNPRG